uniref:Alpha- and gamma-adaptin-binding protein p34 n=3 Tax=Cacopsylla melanoneura TaxID=428564 RepID=A0A8D8V9K2_9HEMI
MESSVKEDSNQVMNEGLPTALFIGVSSDPVEILTKLLKVESRDNLKGSPTEEHVESFPWKIDNKYYTADIKMSVLNSKAITTPEFAESVEAVILCVDTTKETCMTDVESWLPYIKDYNTSIEMFVCKNCSDKIDAKPCKNDVTKWCLENEFELVELEPLDVSEDETDEDDYENDFRDVYGVDRIAQALHAHMWSNLVRKERTEPTTFEALMSGGAQHEEYLASASSQPLELEDKISQLLSGADPPPDMEFGELFQELASMKERMNGMSTDRRKKTAEQIVMAFWRGIGGDDEELELSEEEDKCRGK